MIGPGTHAGFILAAYAATAIILGGVILASWLSLRAARARLGRLEALFPEGGRRSS
ncbi:MAG: heme exporter protein CcmD [Beijerinckiaceae bacterium]|nr:heme exporter protein CcmD [Beijerinckiaceae bacterium]